MVISSTRKIQESLKPEQPQKPTVSLSYCPNWKVRYLFNWHSCFPRNKIFSGNWFRCKVSYCSICLTAREPNFVKNLSDEKKGKASLLSLWETGFYATFMARSEFISSFSHFCLLLWKLLLTWTTPHLKLMSALVSWSSQGAWAPIQQL